MSELNGFFSLRTPLDLLQKLEADFNRLCAADQSNIQAQYAAFDFFVCAEHLPDWLSSTSGISKTKLRSYPYGALVSHIANGAKHFRVDPSRHKTVQDTIFENGAFQGNAFQGNAFQVPHLVIELEDGYNANVLDIASSVIIYWRKIIQ